MCYSQEVWADYRAYVKNYGATLDIKEFYDLFYRQLHGVKQSIPKGVGGAFSEPITDDQRAIKALIDAFSAGEAARLEEGLFAQKKRLADAERKLQVKETKVAAESARIAANKIEWSLAKLADLKRTEPKARDARIFPNSFCPVMVWENGQRVIKPMRYGCRPTGKPAFYDTKYPGTFNARRDNLEGFWKGQFGFTHGVLLSDAFFENVNKHRLECRQLADGEEIENVILKFEPDDGREMLVACLWSHWTGAGQPDLLSFAAITDDPPPEVSAAGHDRCIIPLKAGNIDAWLQPDPNNLAACYSVLDDRERPYYSHQLAMAA